MTIARLSTCSPAASLMMSVHALCFSHRRVLSLALFVYLWVSVALGLGSAHAQGLSRIDALGQTYTASKAVPASLSRLTFYRPANDAGAEAISVYIDDAYHTSLLKGAYAQACLKPGTAAIGLRRVEGATDARNPINAFELTLQNGQQQFLRVSDQPGAQPILLAVPTAQVNAELTQTRQQIHTLSRIASVVPCEGAPAVAAAPVVAPVAALPPQVISLASDALFPFGKSGLGDMLQNGRLALDAVVNRVKTEYASVDNIRVIGHSDPIGRPIDKQRISSQRAQTVQDYISSNGLQSTQILSVGRADNELIVDNCGNRPTPSSIACNAPNRRVSIEISGIRR